MSSVETIEKSKIQPLVVRPQVALRVWLVDLTYTQQTIAADVMPHAIGGIATYAEKHLALPEPIRLFKYPEKLAAALDAGPIPDVIGFSNYIWNASLSEGFARAIKARSPRTVVVLGGPNYSVDPKEQTAYLRARPDVDFYICKEGELAFQRLLLALHETDRDLDAVRQCGIASVHSIASNGDVFLPSTVERIRDLTEIPSPYVTGKLDEFFDGMLLPIVQTNRGCPFSCTFCVEGVGYYNKVYANSTEKISAELGYIGTRMQELRPNGGRNDLFIADSNFGMYRDDLDTCRELARTRKDYGWPEYINVATGKNQKERVLEASRLIDGALRLSGSVQSLDPEVLSNIKRANISSDGLMDLALRASEVGANSYSEIILGLPGDSKVKHFKTVQTVMDAGFTNIYLFQLMLLPGTEMATPASQQKYGMDVRYRVLPRCYGHFDVLGQKVIAAEVEEICVASKTLSFEDYLDCRKMHLVVTLFHNDGVFGSLLKLLRLNKISVWRWMELLTAAPLEGGLADVFASFRVATESELWLDRGQLEAFIREPGKVQQFIAGELGNNLLFVHKTLAVTQHAHALAALARTTVRQLLEESGLASDENLQFVDDALAYHLARMSHLFDRTEGELTAELRFDMPRYDEDGKPDAVDAYRLDGPIRYRFVLDDGQRALIRRYLGIYGSSPVGIGRILSKVYVRKLFRQAVVDGAATSGELSEFKYRIAGLQN